MNECTRGDTQPALLIWRMQPKGEGAVLWGRWPAEVGAKPGHKGGYVPSKGVGQRPAQATFTVRPPLERPQATPSPRSWRASGLALQAAGDQQRSLPSVVLRMDTHGGGQ